MAKYGWSQKLKQKYGYDNFMDAQGRVSRVLNQNEMMYGFDAYDRQLHARQVAFGKSQVYAPPA
ncbi:MAG: hypothetical protein J6X42_06415 [Alphaproteobacteria bacterium]|nr:hypothetical protein [Alphaproteobacteria bacterium]